MEQIFKEKYNPTGAEFTLYEDGVIFIFYARATSSEEENNLETRWVRDVFLKVCQKYPKTTYKILMDVSKPGSSEELSEETKKIYIELLKHPRISKVGVYGQTWGFQLILDLFVALTRSKKLKSFHSKEEALVWLKK